MKGCTLYFQVGNALCRRNKPFLFCTPIGCTILLLVAVFSGDRIIETLLFAGTFPWVSCLVAFSYLMILLGVFTFPFYIAGLILLRKSKR